MKYWGLTLLAAGLLVACSAANHRATPTIRATGNSYYVAPTGDDANPGTEAEPWKTIQHAADTLAAGDTVYVRAGVYNEAVSINVSGSAEGGVITFRNYPGETPVLDGSGLSDPAGDNGFYIADQSYLVIQGFEIRNYTTTLRDAVPMGIQIEGAAHHIQLLDNHIHHIETHAPVDANRLGADAHGIAVYGNSAQPIHDLVIDGNELDHLTLGSSEALTLNGNVETFTVTHNLVHDTDNIGIVMIGFEDTAPDPTLDRARDGVVSDNTVYNVDSYGNPAYGNERSAGGIYVDGGTNIVIERNRVYNANIGIEVASEHGDGNASYITVRNNLIYHNHIAGIAIGGYDTDRGYAESCVIVHNTLYHNDTTASGNGELMIQYDTRNNVIKNNILYAGSQGLLIGNAFVENSGNVVDYNLYYAPTGADDSEWVWKDVSYVGFDAYRAATGNDAHSLFANPQFADETAPDLHLQATSPAINAGENLAEAGEQDIDGDARVQGGTADIGADEYSSTTVYLPLVTRS